MSTTRRKGTRSRTSYLNLADDLYRALGGLLEADPLPDARSVAEGVLDEAKQSTVGCSQCGRLFLPLPGNLKRGRGKFCSPDCYWGWTPRTPTPGWKAVPEFPWYEAHPDGSVRRIGRQALKPNLSANRAGYPYITLMAAPGKPSTFSLHTIICRTFHGPPPTPEHEVGHWDGNRKNAASSNLRWVTLAENYADRIRHGTQVKSGEQNPTSILKDAQVLEIRRRYRELDNKAARHQFFPQLAAEFGVSVGSIQKIAYRGSWRHLP